MIDADASSHFTIICAAETTASSTAARNNRICVYEDMVFIPHYTGMEIFTIKKKNTSYSFKRVTDLQRPSHLKMKENFSIRNVFIKDNIAHLDRFEYIIDISDIENMRFIKCDKDYRLSTGKNLLVGNNLFCFDSNILIYDIDDPKKPELITRFIR